MHSVIIFKFLIKSNYKTNFFFAKISIQVSSNIFVAFENIKTGRVLKISQKQSFVFVGNSLLRAKAKTSMFAFFN
jgi:hypothetical protein